MSKWKDHIVVVCPREDCEHEIELEINVWDYPEDRDCPRDSGVEVQGYLTSCPKGHEWTKEEQIEVDRAIDEAVDNYPADSAWRYAEEKSAEDDRKYDEWKDEQYHRGDDQT